MTISVSGINGGGGDRLLTFTNCIVCLYYLYSRDGDIMCGIICSGSGGVPIFAFHFFLPSALYYLYSLYHLYSRDDDSVCVVSMVVVEVVVTFVPLSPFRQLPFTACIGFATATKLP